MKILIYGAGVLGSLLASQLTQIKEDVSILARGQRLTEIQKHGIIIENIVHKTTTTIHCKTVDTRLTKDTNFDLIIVLMQKNHVHSILPDLQKYSPNATICFMGNNGTGIQDYIKYIDESRILLGFFSAAGRRNQNILQVVFDNRMTRIHLGEPNGTISERVTEIQKILEKAGNTVIVRENMDAWLKTHIAKVSPLANLYYMLKSRGVSLEENSEEMDIAVKGVQESIKVLKHLGYPIIPSSFEAQVSDPAILRKVILRMFNWEWFEVALKGHVEYAVDEMQYLADEFQLLIEKSGLSTPHIHQLYEFIPKQK